jgi:hypothetical protein
MNTVAMWIGYVTMVSGGVLFIAGVVWSAAYAINVSCSKALASYGGWKVFKEFVKWHRQNKNAGGGV